MPDITSIDWAKLPTEIATLIALGNLIYVMKKDRGRSTQRSETIKRARDRLAFWETKVKLQSLLLEGGDLKRERNVALEAIYRIHAEADASLALLAWKPYAHIVGLRWWQRYLLLYRPMLDDSKRSAYVNRMFYWVFLVFLAFWVCLLSWIFIHIMRYAHSSVWNQLQRLSQEKDFIAFAKIGFLVTLLLLLSAVSSYWSAKKEYIRPRFSSEPVTRI